MSISILVQTRSEQEEKAVLAFLDNLNIEYQTEFEEDWADLPDDVISDVKVSIKQFENGEGISHFQARETFKKWL